MNDITLYPDFIPYSDANWYLKRLEKNIPWEIPTPKSKRKMAYFAYKGDNYEYAGLQLQCHKLLYHSSLEGILQQVANKLDIELNSVLLNYYPDGRSEIRWHSDKETQLGEAPIIPCINLGTTRKFHFMEKSTGNKFFYEVKNGDLLVMGPNCQKNYLHAILKETHIKEPRISLTYRYVYDVYDNIAQTRSKINV